MAKYIIVDANTWAEVFSPDCLKHEQFKPVQEVIENKKAILAYGGTKYYSELARCEKYAKIHLELSKAGKAQKFDKERIDAEEGRVHSIGIIDSAFDDQHIIALQIISRANVICSKDIRAYPFFKNKKLYPKKHTPFPTLYTKLKNSAMLLKTYC